MKYFFLLILAAANLCTEAQPPKLYLYLVSHNEDNIGYLNVPAGRTSYLAARNVLINIANLVQAKGLAYDYGADWVALKAVARYDTGSIAATTAGKNLVRWMVENKGVQADPHSHESSYNYGDVAYLMSQLGVNPGRVMSGYLYNQLQNGHSWEAYQNGARGDSFSFYTWYPEIKWGAGSPNHVADLNMFGVYRPKSMAEFTVHAPGNHLIFCGTGCPLKLNDTATAAYKFSQIKQIANDIQSGVLPSNGIYMQEIFFSEGDIRQPWFMPLLNNLTDSLATLVSGGKAAWKSIPDIVDVWKADFNNRPFAVACDYTVVLNPLGVGNEPGMSSISVSPNPVADMLQLRFGNAAGQPLYIMNGTGQVVYAAAGGQSALQIDVRNWLQGVYYVRMGAVVRRIVKM